MDRKLTKDIDTIAVTYKTSDYSQFKTLDGNRNIDDKQVTRLCKSIEKKDLLHQNPILVNEKMEIIDGQHRLLAAQAIGRPIYYRIEKESNLEDTILLNANNRKWITDDYLSSFVKLGKKEYIKVQEFKDKYKISSALAILILSKLDQVKAIAAFRDGTFAVADEKNAEEVASFMVELRALNRDGAWHDRDLIKTLPVVMEKIDPKLILSKMNQHNLFLTRRISVKEYLLQFEEILNFQNNGQVIELT